MNMKKILAFALCLVLVAGLSIGGTLAWITAQTSAVTNTFTYGDINIDLKEHDYLQASNTLDKTTEVTSESDYKMVPGNKMPKDPFVKVVSGSEACWLFVKVEEANDLATFIDYSVDTSIWTKLTGVEGVDNVWYCQVAASANDQTFDVLTDDQVTVKNVTKKQLTGIGTNKPALTFTAYAVQKDNVADAATAWSYIPADQK